VQSTLESKEKQVSSQKRFTFKVTRKPYSVTGKGRGTIVCGNKTCGACKGGCKSTSHH